MDSQVRKDVGDIKRPETGELERLRLITWSQEIFVSKSNCKSCGYYR